MVRYLQDYYIGSMASKPKRRKVKRTSIPLTRAELLPMPASRAQTISLRNHMAFVALRLGQGNIDLAGELLKLIHITYHLLDEACPTDHRNCFAGADEAIRALIRRATSANDWHLGDAHCLDIQTILNVHDAQLRWLPAHRVDAGMKQLMRSSKEGVFPALRRAPRAELEQVATP